MFELLLTFVWSLCIGHYASLLLVPSPALHIHWSRNISSISACYLSEHGNLVTCPDRLRIIAARVKNFTATSIHPDLSFDFLLFESSRSTSIAFILMTIEVCHNNKPQEPHENCPIPFGASEPVFCNQHHRDFHYLCLDRSDKQIRQAFVKHEICSSRA